MLDRNTPPTLADINRPSLWPVQRHTLPNGIEVVYLHDPHQDVFKVDVVLPAGRDSSSFPG